MDRTPRISVQKYCSLAVLLVGITVNYGIKDRKELQALSEWRNKEGAINKGRSTPYFPYKIDKFRPSLQITDSNGENLLFHSFERYKQYKKYNNIISIRFPKNNPLERNEHRLIKMQYINCLRQTNLKEANLTVGVFKNASIYSFIKSVKDMNSLLITNLSKFILMIELQIFKQKGIQLIMKSSAIQKKL